MSAPGFTNRNTSTSAGYNQNSTPSSAAAAPAYRNGTEQSYPAMYPPTSPYPHPPLHQTHSGPPPSKALTNTGHTTNYFHQQNNQHLQPHLPQHHPPPTVAPPAVRPPHPSAAAAQQYTPALPTNALYDPPPQQALYCTPDAYYGQQTYHAPQAQQLQHQLPHQQQQQQQHQPPVNGVGAPLYPIVSYPSAPGSSQYGTLRSSQSPCQAPGAVPTLVGAPLHQHPQTSADTSSLPPAFSTTAVQQFCGAPTTNQTSPAYNGTAHHPDQPTSHQRHYDQNNHAAALYDPYQGVPYGNMTADGDRPPSGSTTTSVHSSPRHQQGMHYGYDANRSGSLACEPSPATGPSDSSSEEEEDDDEDEDEEAGGDTSSSTTGSASPVPNNFDCLEGGSYPDSIAPSGDMPNHSPPYNNYGYPGMQPAYQQGPASHGDSSPSHALYGQQQPQQYAQPFPNMSTLSAALGGLSGVPELELEALMPVNLLHERSLLPDRPLEAPEPNLSPDLRKVNCSPQTFRCTLSSIPQTQALLNKARLPLGLLLHPFRDLQQLPVITSNTIVRCRSCRTYINPFVSFLDQRRWKCNLCYRVNDVPDEFMYNPVTRSYGEPHKRPEVQNATVEFIASSDYMLRPPQPAVYLFVLDVSHNAVEAGYLQHFCDSLLDNLDKLPGDTRMRVGFLTFDSTVHFYNLQQGLSQPQMLVVSDIDDIFIPSHDSLMVNLKDSLELVKDLLGALPSMFRDSRVTHSALGPALQAAHQLMAPTGGRISVFQTQLPSLGAGLLPSREDPNQRSSSKGVQHLGPATDFYKKLALDCSGQQIAVDLFLLSSQYADLATLACVSKYSAGSIFYYPSYHHVHNPAQRDKFRKDLDRYLSRKIGFEAVMRIRCTKGLSIHTFHGNFFVRSTDLLSLANVNPDSAFAVQMSIDDSLVDSSLACFQAALLYTSSKGKRRIRVHTLCLPVVSQLSDVFAGADVQAITCLLANMAIDRSVSSSLGDARDALLNAVVDGLGVYRNTVSTLQQHGLIAPDNLRLFPLYILALLKQKALRTGTSTRLDERVFAMCEFKTQPLQQMMRMVYPDMYRMDTISDQGSLHLNDTVVPQPRLLHLSAERLSRDGAFLLDCGSVLYLWVGKCVNEIFIRDVLGCPNYASIPPNMTDIPELETKLSERVRAFLDWLQDNRAFSCLFYVVREDASAKLDFFQNMVEDRSEMGLSYHEFLQNLLQQMSK
ncbi:protein transport protein Sec24B isoform X3 [Gadus morhua]|uniref:protein transport protein Sec24B isoform X3 n=1 Tax=Gadus morhua TaxID=8049 RepID=UPI0011B487ED|nr:protein transport protein Sec24B-like isoform X3 [Gadus morhua]